MAVGGQRHTPAAYPLNNRPGTHCTEDWVGPRAGLDWSGKTRLPPGFDPRTFQSVASHCTDIVRWRVYWNPSSMWSRCCAHHEEVKTGSCAVPMCLKLSTGEWSDSRPGRLTPYHWLVGWSDSRNRQDVFGKQKNLLLLSGIEVLYFEFSNVKHSRFSSFNVD